MVSKVAPELVRSPGGRLALPQVPLYHGISSVSMKSPLCNTATAYDAATDILSGMRGIQYAKDPDMGLLHPIEGSMSCPYTLVAGLQYKDAEKRIKFHEKIGDAAGAKLAKADRAKAGFTATWGATTLVERPLSFVAFVKHTEVSLGAPTLLGRVAYVMGAAGSLFLGLLYVVLSAISGYTLYKTLSWKKNVDADFLRQKTEPVALVTIDKTPEELTEIALKQGARWLKQMLQAMDKEGVLDNPKLTKEEKKELARRLFNTPEMSEALMAKYGEDVWNECMQMQNDDVLQAFGLALSKEYADAAKIQELTRVLGKDLAKEVWEAADITDELVKKAEAALGWKKVAKDVFVLLLSLMAVGMIILGAMSSVLYTTIAAFLYSALSFIAGAFADLPGLLDYLKNGEVGKFDKVVAIIGLALAALIVGGLIAAMVVFTGPTPFIIMALIATVWMGAANGLVLGKIARDDLKHPTLQSLNDRLRYCMGDELARKVFLGCEKEGYRGLSKEDLALAPYILNKLRKNPAKMREADLIKNIELMREGDIKYVVSELLELREKQKKEYLGRMKHVVEEHLPHVRPAHA